MSADGITDLRNRKAQRSTRQALPPRHPIPARAREELADPTREDPAPGAVAEQAVADQAVAADGATVPRPVGSVSGRSGSGAMPIVDPSTPPDVNVDWSDPRMHVTKQTRISVASSVATRFKSVAERPGAPPQTQLIMEAVDKQLPRLAELVLARRPDSQQPEGFFLRRSVAQAREPWLPVYLRPNVGEIEALAQIVQWVNAVIGAQPGRKPTSRSEVVTAALDATYPAPASRRGS